MLFVNNTSVNSDFLTKLTEQITSKHSGDGALFDNNDAIEKAKSDMNDNNDLAEDIKQAANNAALDSKAQANAKEKAEKMSEWETTGQFNQKWKIKGEPIVKDNTATLKLTDENGKEVGTKTWKYAPDGSYVVTCKIKIDGKEENAIEVYDKNAQLRRKSQTDTEGVFKAWQYDEDGTLNQTKVVDKNGKTTSAWYDDSGQKTYQIIKDGVKTNSYKFEYDSSGKLVGEYKVSKYNKGGASETTITTHNTDGTKTVFTKSAQDKTTTLRQYDKAGDMISQTDKDKDGKVTREQTFDKPIYGTINANGTLGEKSVNVVVKENGKTYYQTNEYDSNGRLTKQVRYSDEAKTKKIGEWSYKYNDKGYKTEMVKTAYGTGDSKTTTTVKYDSETGAEKERKVKKTGQEAKTTETTQSTLSEKEKQQLESYKEELKKFELYLKRANDCKKAEHDKWISYQEKAQTAKNSTYASRAYNRYCEWQKDISDLEKEIQTLKTKIENLEQKQ